MLCWREGSHRKTIKEILPELQKTDLTAVREVSRLLISRWRAEAPRPRLEVTRPLPKEVKPPSWRNEHRSLTPAGYRDRIHQPRRELLNLDAEDAGGADRWSPDPLDPVGDRVPLAGTLPVTERLLGRLPGRRVAWVLAWAVVPVVAGLLPSAYVASVGAGPLPVRLLARLVFAYVVVLAFWAVGRFTRESSLVERSVDQLAAGPEQAATPVFRGCPAPGAAGAHASVCDGDRVAHGSRSGPGRWPPSVSSPSSCRRPR